MTATVQRIAICGLLLLSIPYTARATDLAVVVHADNPLDSLSLGDLRQLYLGRKTFFPDGTNVRLMEYRPVSESFYRGALGMTLLQFRKHWIREVFSGAYSTPPQTKKTAYALAQALCRERGAIGFVAADAVDSCMKILAIDGFTPGDESYPLKK